MESQCRACIFVYAIRSVAKKSRPRLVNALVTVLFLLSPGVALVNLRHVRTAADCNGATKKKTMKKRRKCPGTRYRPGQIRFPGLFVMLHLSLRSNGWPFKTSRCHFEQRARLLSFSFFLLFFRSQSRKDRAKFARVSLLLPLFLRISRVPRTIDLAIGGANLFIRPKCTHSSRARDYQRLRSTMSSGKTRPRGINFRRLLGSLRKPVTSRRYFSFIPSGLASCLRWTDRKSFRKIDRQAARTRQITRDYTSAERA